MWTNSNIINWRVASQRHIGFTDSCLLSTRAMGVCVCAYVCKDVAMDYFYFTGNKVVHGNSICQVPLSFTLTPSLTLVHAHSPCPAACAGAEMPRSTHGAPSMPVPSGAGRKCQPPHRKACCGEISWFTLDVQESQTQEEISTQDCKCLSSPGGWAPWTRPVCLLEMQAKIQFESTSKGLPSWKVWPSTLVRPGKETTPNDLLNFHHEGYILPWEFLHNLNKYHSPPWLHTGVPWGCYKKDWSLWFPSEPQKSWNPLDFPVLRQPVTFSKATLLPWFWCYPAGATCIKSLVECKE